MPGYSWTEEEKALVLWFASLGLTHTNICKLLHDRKFNRTMTAIRNKIGDLRKEFNLGCSSNQLNFWEVDRWIKQLSLNCDAAELLRPTVEDQTSAYQVRVYPKLFCTWSSDR